MGAGDEHLAARVGPVAGPGGVGGSGGIDQQLGQAACWLGPLHRPEHCQGEQEQERCCRHGRHCASHNGRVAGLYTAAQQPSVSVFVVKLFFLRTALTLSTRSASYILQEARRRPKVFLARSSSPTLLS